jgi:hypothetical protein
MTRIARSMAAPAARLAAMGLATMGPAAMGLAAMGLATVLAALAGAPAARAQNGPPNPSFNLVNKSQQVIKELFATPAGFDNWGRNRLDGKTIAAGATFAVRLPANGNCRYDIRVVTTDGHADDRRDVDTCKTDDVLFSGATGGAPGEAAAPPPGARANVKLINNGASPVAEFYARHAGAADWGPNRLASGDIKLAVAPAAALALAIPFDGSCIFELKVVFENHQSREKRGADLCKMTDLPVK